MPNPFTPSRTIAGRVLSTVVLCGFVHGGAIASDAPVRSPAEWNWRKGTPARSLFSPKAGRAEVPVLQRANDRLSVGELANESRD